MSGWIGVDLDGTLARYDGWIHETHVGDPIPAMLERVRTWLDNGIEVRIVTARVAVDDVPIIGDKARLSSAEICRHIQDWTEKHLGVRLPVTRKKDFGMVELWDDRCVQVIPNTGTRADGKT
jgi:hypothetical protein